MQREIGLQADWLALLVVGSDNTRHTMALSRSRAISALHNRVDCRFAKADHSIGLPFDFKGVAL